MKEDNNELREQAALESLLGDLKFSRTESFSPGFATRVASAAADHRMNKSSIQYEAFKNLKSAFFGTTVAWAAACLVLFLWIHFHSDSTTTNQPTAKTQSVEDALQNVTYTAVEEML